MVGEVTPLAPPSLTHPLVFLTPEEPDHTSIFIDAGGPKRLKFRDVLLCSSSRPAQGQEQSF